MDNSTLGLGQRIRLCSTSPIESEGVAPGPGHAGVLVETPARGDARRCWGVRFEGISLVWRIPEQLLESVDDMQVVPLRSRDGSRQPAHAA